MLKIKVDGMTCDGCARSVSRAINTAYPRAKVAVDRPSGWVTIEGEVELVKVGEAVTTAGFAVSETVTSWVEGQAQLPRS
ncbi:MAG: heavy-metal-associated domain-containing protein [Alphaproteobacteria bacterium]|nr:heavy-metal-associated domain-containing protein [Alphaproteobacteria bacterium]